MENLPTLPNWPRESRGSALPLLPETLRHLPPPNRHLYHRGVESWIVVVKMMLKSVDALLNHQLHIFDPIVGNNSCYLTSARVVEIAQRHQERGVEAVGELQRLKGRLHGMLKEAEEAAQRPTRQKLLYPICASQLAISDDFLYLTMAMGCSVVDGSSTTVARGIDYSLLNMSSETRARRLVLYWQRELSRLGLKFLHRLASHLKQADQRWGTYVQTPYILTDSAGRSCSPSLYATRILLDSFSYSPRNLVSLSISLYDEEGCHRDRFKLFFKGSEGEEKFEPVDPAELESLGHRPTWVIGGCSINRKFREGDLVAVRERYKEMGLMHLVMAHEVTYPLYPRSIGRQELTPDDPLVLKEVLAMRQLTGYSFDDPSILCLTHLYADTVAGQLASPPHNPPEQLPALG